MDQALEDENADLFCLQTSVSQVIVFIVNFKVANIIISVSCSILHPTWIQSNPSTYSLHCDIRLRRHYFVVMIGLGAD